MTQSLPIEDQQNQGVAASPPLSHPSGAEPVPVSGKAGIANAGDALLPCPFCGSDPVPDYCSSTDGPAYLFHCQSKDCPAWPSVQGETEAEAIAAWNTRKSAAPLLLEALERITAFADAPAETPVGPIKASDMARQSAMHFGIFLIQELPSIRAAISSARGGQ